MNILPQIVALGIAGWLLIIPAFEARADWLSEANTRIEQLRKRDWTVRVNDAAGMPVSGATVQVRQRRHAFAFGSALNSFALVAEPRYAEFFARNFEWAVFENETKWTDNEPVQGQLAYARADLMAAFCRKQGITMRGHTIFWEPTSGGYEQPGWVKLLTGAPLRAAVEARLNSVVPRYLGTFQHWDINNELLHGSFFRDRLGAEIVPFMFQRTRELDPRARRFVNDYNVVAGTETGAYKAHIEQLIASGAAVEGIGAQGHFGGQIIDPVVVKTRLDTLATLNLPIWITEYDSVQASAATRASNLEVLYRVAFSHPGVEGILMWGFWANAHWLGANAAIVDADWTVNAAGQKYQSLLNEWTTVTSATTDGNGIFSLRGFHGDYDLRLSATGQTTVTRAVELNAGTGTQSDSVMFGATPDPPLAGESLGGSVETLRWSRFSGGGSCVVESSTGLDTWSAVSPKLDPLATEWSHRLTPGESRRFFRVRDDPLPPPDFDFSEAAGARRAGTINATGQLAIANTNLLHRDAYLFTAPDLRNGVLSLTEDAAEPSPDGGPPGVLRFKIDAKPTTVSQEYWGFILRPGSVAEWPGGGLTGTHLGQTRLRFRYKLTSTRAINVRVEPRAGGYANRCDFGNLTGNGQWQEFSRLLSAGTNGSAFLAYLNTGERQLIVVFGNGAALATYATGDTLLLDDVSIYYE